MEYLQEVMVVAAATPETTQAEGMVEIQVEMTTTMKEAVRTLAREREMKVATAETFRHRSLDRAANTDGMSFR